MVQHTDSKFYGSLSETGIPRDPNAPKNVARGFRERSYIYIYTILLRI
jgi:hypothetical protein